MKTYLNLKKISVITIFFSLYFQNIKSQVYFSPANIQRMDTVSSKLGTSISHLEGLVESLNKQIPNKVFNRSKLVNTRDALLKDIENFSNLKRNIEYIKAIMDDASVNQELIEFANQQEGRKVLSDYATDFNQAISEINKLRDIQESDPEQVVEVIKNRLGTQGMQKLEQYANSAQKFYERVQSHQGLFSDIKTFNIRLQNIKEDAKLADLSFESKQLASNAFADFANFESFYNSFNEGLESDLSSLQELNNSNTREALKKYTSLKQKYNSSQNQSLLNSISDFVSENSKEGFQEIANAADRALEGLKAIKNGTLKGSSLSGSIKFSDLPKAKQVEINGQIRHFEQVKELTQGLANKYDKIKEMYQNYKEAKNFFSYTDEQVGKLDTLVDRLENLSEQLNAEPNSIIDWIKDLFDKLFGGSGDRTPANKITKLDEKLKDIDLSEGNPDNLNKVISALEDLERKYSSDGNVGYETPNERVDRPNEGVDRLGFDDVPGSEYSFHGE